MDIKNLKIRQLDISNFKNIWAISYELWDYVVVWGKNWNWKSSFVQSVFAAINSNKFLWVSHASLVKSGEDKATIYTNIVWDGWDIDITREFKKGTAKNPWGSTTLTATKNWKKISQAELDTLMKAISLDPMKLWELSIAKQMELIQETTWLDTSEIDKKIADQIEDRKEANALKKRMVAVYEQAIQWWVPKEVEEADIKWLLEWDSEYNKLDAKLQEFRNAKAEITQLEERLKRANELKDSLAKEWKELKASLVQKYWTREELQESIENISENNKKADDYKDYLKAKKDKEEAEKEAEKEESELKHLREAKQIQISESNLPEYMEISWDTWIMVDGTEYKLLNTARKIEVWIDLVLLSETPLKVIRIENWGEFDTDTLELIKEKVLKHWFQVIIERPMIDKFDEIVISDGELIEWEELKAIINKQ